LAELPLGRFVALVDRELLPERPRPPYRLRAPPGTCPLVALIGVLTAVCETTSPAAGLEGAVPRCPQPCRCDDASRCCGVDAKLTALAAQSARAGRLGKSCGPDLLSFAARKGVPELVAILLAAGIGPSRPRGDIDYTGDTQPMYEAAQRLSYCHELDPRRTGAYHRTVLALVGAYWERSALAGDSSGGGIYLDMDCQMRLLEGPEKREALIRIIADVNLGGGIYRVVAKAWVERRLSGWTEVRRSGLHEVGLRWTTAHFAARAVRTTEAAIAAWGARHFQQGPKRGEPAVRPTEVSPEAAALAEAGARYTSFPLPPGLTDARRMLLLPWQRRTAIWTLRAAWLRGRRHGGWERRNPKRRAREPSPRWSWRGFRLLPRELVDEISRFL
ncbi:MAG: hypothetical protein VYE81_03720, partial [Planctomycetota bacterium]|nr:hypothetical protein [Planctomycetota bacterium]